MATETFVECYTSMSLPLISSHYFSCIHLPNGGKLPWLPTVFGLLWFLFNPAISELIN